MNKVFLIGNIGKDPEVKYINSGVKVASFSLATYRNKEESDWHNIICFDKVAEIAENHIKKGGKVAIYGRIQYRNWEKPDGSKGYATEIIATEIKLLSAKEQASAETPKQKADREKQEEPEYDLPF